MLILTGLPGLPKRLSYFEFLLSFCDSGWMRLFLDLRYFIAALSPFFFFPLLHFFLSKPDFSFPPIFFFSPLACLFGGPATWLFSYAYCEDYRDALLSFPFVSFFFFLAIQTAFLDSLTF